MDGKEIGGLDWWFGILVVHPNNDPFHEGDPKYSNHQPKPPIN